MEDRVKKPLLARIVQVLYTLDIVTNVLEALGMVAGRAGKWAFE